MEYNNLCVICTKPLCIRVDDNVLGQRPEQKQTHAHCAYHSPKIDAQLLHNDLSKTLAHPHPWPEQKVVTTSTQHKMVCEENPTESRRSTRLTRSLAAVDPTTVFPSHASTNFPASQSHNIKSSLLVGTFSGSFPFDVNNHRLQMALYRPAAPVPEHIREHCTIYLDEQLCKSYTPN